MVNTNIIKYPLITEKISVYNEVQRERKENKGQEHEEVYTFVVDKKANKIEIKKAIEKMYGVNVESVRTSIYKGKPKTRYTKSQIITGHTASYKKAYITVAEGDIIDFYSNL